MDANVVLLIGCAVAMIMKRSHKGWLAYWGFLLVGLTVVMAIRDRPGPEIPAWALWGILLEVAILAVLFWKWNGTSRSVGSS